MSWNIGKHKKRNRKSCMRIPNNNNQNNERMTYFFFFKILFIILMNEIKILRNVIVLSLFLLSLYRLCNFQELHQLQRTQLWTHFTSRHKLQYHLSPTAANHPHQVYWNNQINFIFFYIRHQMLSSENKNHMG
jgi:hypothetical protein